MSLAFRDTWRFQHNTGNQIELAMVCDLPEIKKPLFLVDKLEENRVTRTLTHTLTATSPCSPNIPNSIWKCTNVYCFLVVISAVPPKCNPFLAHSYRTESFIPGVLPVTIQQICLLGFWKILGNLDFIAFAESPCRLGAKPRLFSPFSQMSSARIGSFSYLLANQMGLLAVTGGWMMPKSQVAIAQEPAEMNTGRIEERFLWFCDHLTDICTINYSE